MGAQAPTLSVTPEVIVPKDLIDLLPDDCRFPVTDLPPHAFCAEPAIPGEPYCPHHQAICYGTQGRRTLHTISRVGFKLQEELQPAPPPKPVDGEIILDVTEIIR